MAKRPTVCIGDACRDSRLSAVSFRTLYFLAAQVQANGVVEITPKILEDGAHVKQSAFTGALASLINCGYAETVGPTDRLPYRLRLRVESISGRSSRRNTGGRRRQGDGCRQLLAIVVELAGAVGDRPLAWRDVKARFLAEHARDGDKAAQADSLRRRVSRYRDQLVLEGHLVVQGRAVQIASSSPPCRGLASMSHLRSRSNSVVACCR